MREEFYENSAMPSNEKTQKVFYTIYTVIIVLLVIALAISLMMALLFLDLGFLFIAIFVALFGVLFWLVRRKLLTYFDYTFVSGEVRVIRLINGKYRKRFVVFDARDVYIMGKVGSDSFDRLWNTPNIKRKIATPNGLGAEKQLYYVGVKINGENCAVIIECEEKFLTYIISYSGKNSVEKEYDK